jgi:hypothetical protein
MGKLLGACFWVVFAFLTIGPFVMTQTADCKLPLAIPVLTYRTDSQILAKDCQRCHQSPKSILL